MAHDARTSASPSFRGLIVGATGAYLANCVLGALVATGTVDTGRYRWVHHAMFIATATLTATAVIAGTVSRSRTAALLAPALIPLAYIPYAGRRRHAAVAISAAPWYTLALAASTRS